MLLHVYKKIAISLTLISVTTNLCFSDSTLNNISGSFSSEKPFVIGLISDMHILSDTYPYLAQAVNNWNNKKTNINVLLGDNIDGSSDATDAIGVARINNDLSTATANTFVVFGSHDKRAGVPTSYSRYNNSVNATLGYSSTECGQYHCVFLETQNVGYFQLNQTEIDWLTNDLAQTNKPCLVFGHTRLDVDYPGDLTDGFELGDLNNQLTAWSITGINVNNSTLFGLYWTLTKSVSNVTINLYKESTKTTLQASGTITSDSGTITIAQQNSSGISGSVNVNYTLDDTDVGNTIAYGEFTYWPYGEMSLNAQAVRTIFENSGKVKFYFNGHTHFNSHKIVNGIKYINIKHSTDANNSAVIYIYGDGSISRLNGSGSQETFYDF